MNFLIKLEISTMYNVTSHVLCEILEDEIRQESELELVLAVDDKRCSHIR